MDSLHDMDLMDMNVLDEADIDNGVPAGYQDGNTKEENGNEEEDDEDEFDEDEEILIPSIDNDEVWYEVFQLSVVVAFAFPVTVTQL